MNAEQLQKEVDRLQKQLAKMTKIADTFNLQLNILCHHLGSAEFNRILDVATLQKEQADGKN